MPLCIFRKYKNKIPTGRDALEMIEEGLSANEIKLKLEQAKQKMAIFIAVDDLKYLRRGGRISSGATIFNVSASADTPRSF